MEKNFVQADNTNLPKIDAISIARFFKNNPDFYAVELKNVKTAISARESYGDDAIGYVQLNRESGICTVKCKITPEHKIRSRCYNLTMVVNEDEGEIVSCLCHDCAAAAGGCKHAVAFLMWTHRRSEEPACTSVECYWRKSTLSKVGTTLKYITVKQLCKKEVMYSWRKSTLSKVGTTLKYITVKQLCKKEVPCHPNSSAVLEEFLSEAKIRKIENCELLKYQSNFQYTSILQYSLHHFMMGRVISQDDVNNVLKSMKETLNTDVIKSIEEATRNNKSG
ncbi:hypothetical protein QE152_g11184 [Popillia japonica]|uniref:SWIM-type domain-containing protein n=1 Tax=Popillia japonica TaxID=7064 RepID=A0AAW1LSB4_POPJA